ncbi:hypothetical protein M404DRAFT_991670 [Pisolithus tinctorius Marx 270]|uniref:Uncharacterized protein n=1 Tax=Pisolithus tinctorius Marx 270 TaxID=870435 RepID=A0A0C3PZP3_PISTI|nr:hypothetical protein M404DRAFT_991670 [Pisolithus tinctorius Marx 270]
MPTPRRKRAARAHLHSFSLPQWVFRLLHRAQRYSRKGRNAYGWDRQIQRIMRILHSQHAILAGEERYLTRFSPKKHVLCVMINAL